MRLPVLSEAACEEERGADRRGGVQGQQGIRYVERESERLSRKRGSL
jgi:hypothetical protein